MQKDLLGFKIRSLLKWSAWLATSIRSLHEQGLRSSASLTQFNRGETNMLNKKHTCVANKQCCNFEMQHDVAD